MKKSLAILGGIFTFSVLSLSSNVYADTIKNENKDINSKVNIIQEENEISKEIDPIVMKDGSKDGTNDPSSVQIKIKKISDNPQFFSMLGAGEWDYLGASTFKGQSKTFYSGGGDLRIYISQPSKGPGFKWLYKLVEEDEIFNDTVSSFGLPNSGGTYQVDFNVRSYVDGNNGLAELHLEKLTNPFDSVNTEWYD